MKQSKKTRIVVLLLFSFIATSCQQPSLSASTTSVPLTTTLPSDESATPDFPSLTTSSETPPTSSVEEPSSSGGEDSSTPAPSQLTTPIVEVNSINGLASWNSVINADYYEYKVSGEDIKVTTATSLQLLDKTNISVRAMANDNEKYLNSDFSAAKSFFILDDIVIPIEEKVKVYFHNCNIETMTINKGETILRPEDPIKEHYQFDNWFADPFMSSEFDFNQPLMKDTIIYANFIANTLLDEVYYWVKGDDKMSSTVQSSDSGWKLIPLKRNIGQTNYREFQVTVTVNDTASSSSPCHFLIADGIDTLPGRNYWKDYGNVNFTINSPGTYIIFFSAEHQWQKSNGDLVNVYVSKIVAQQSTSSNSSIDMTQQLETPILSFDNQTHLVTWGAIPGAVTYGYVLNNGNIQYTLMPQLSLEVKEHLSVIAIGDGINFVNSYWSNPVARYNYVLEQEPENEYCHVFFFGLDMPSQAVKKGEKVSKPADPRIEGSRFEGWYSNIARTKEFDFEEKVYNNITLYPKWENDENWTTTEYYYLSDLLGNKIAGLLINQAVTTHYEYSVKFTIIEPINFYVKNREDTKTYGSYSIPSAGTYTVYFSPDRQWNPGTENASNVYIAGDVRTLYFTNSLYWAGTIYGYMWKDSINNGPFPGAALSWVRKNSYDQDIYKISIDYNKYSTIIFSNNDQQTVNILLADLLENGVYVKDTTNSYGRYNYGTFTYSS